MPPKKAPPKKGASARGGSKGKGSKGRGKGKGKGAKGKGKGKKGKGQKVNKKYAGLTFDGKFIAMLPRDQLEAIAEQLYTLMDCEREERIKFQTERDYFGELVNSYMPKLRELKIAKELNVCKLVRIKQDMEDLDPIKRQEAKHFRYEAQLRLSSSQMNDHLREKRTRKKLDRFWKFTCAEDTAVSAKLEVFPADMAEKMMFESVALNTYQEYEDKIRQIQSRYYANMKVVSEHLVEELAMYDWVEELQIDEEAYDIMHEGMNNYEWIGTVSRAYYHQQVHNSLSGIVIMCDHWDDMDADERLYDKLCEKATKKLEDMQKKAKAFVYPFAKGVRRHEGYLRLKKGIATTYDSIRVTEHKIARSMDVFRELYNKAYKIDEELDDFKGCTLEMCWAVWMGFSDMFGEEWMEQHIRRLRARLGEQYVDLQSYFPSKEEADAVVLQNRQLVHAQKLKLIGCRERSLQVLKRHDDMYRSVNAVLMSNSIRKHPIKEQIGPIMIGNMRGVGAQPCGLVADIVYPVRPHTPPKPKKLPYCGDEPAFY